jgi:hypothetical protein
VTERREREEEEECDLRYMYKHRFRCLFGGRTVFLESH